MKYFITLVKFSLSYFIEKLYGSFFFCDIVKILQICCSTFRMLDHAHQ